MVELLGSELFSESLPVTDTDLAQSLRSRRGFRAWRDGRRACGGFIPAQTNDSYTEQLVSRPTHASLLRHGPAPSET